MDIDFKKVVGTVAPFLGTLVGGPFGGIVGKVLGDVLLGNENASEDDIKLALSSASPDKLVQIRKIDCDYKFKMAELGITEKKICAMDRDRAREREIQLKDNVPAFLSLLLTIGFFSILYCLIFYEIPQNSKTVLDIMLGALGTAWISCITYYFGSSYGSQIKTKLFKI